MRTDWNLIRKVLTAAVDACEAAEALGLREADREVSTGPDDVTVFEVWTSARTLPENLLLEVVRARHELDDDLPYIPDSTRVLERVGQLCGGLVGADSLDHARDGVTIRQSVEQMCGWYERVMIPRLAAAASQPNEEGGATGRA